ncbi:hypothetical protein ERJ75_001034300 [Trypanosoma vivax]|nr:hypothetical protein ERJ75_001034300 [Trypanosoma vivax]
MANKALLECRKEITHSQTLNNEVQSVLGKVRSTVNYPVKVGNEVVAALAMALEMEVSILAYKRELESVMTGFSSQLNMVRATEDALRAWMRGDAVLQSPV